MSLKPILRVEVDEVAYQATHGFFKLPDANIQVFSLKAAEQLQQDQLLPSNAQIQIGDTWIKSPYDDKYISIYDYEYVVIKDKINHIIHIAELLGAKSCDFDAAWEEIESRTIDVEGHVNYKVIDAQGSLKKLNSDDIQTRYNVTAERIQGPFNVHTFEEAEKYAKKHFLWSDSDVFSLFQSRDIKNDLVYDKKNVVTIEMSNDLNKNLEIAAKLQMMPARFSLDARFKEITNKRVKFRIKFIIDFTTVTSIV